ncbi:MAG: sulfite exporter TauE/SafE family protein [Myxococcales bacterium]|nr:sulfite exporter TauE/SafE family protein [Myxococcales bacterium]
MLTVLASIFVASVLGSLHCVGMCGGFVAAYATSRATPEGPKRIASAHVAYHGGRLLSYAALGALVGALGRAIDVAGTIAGVARLAAWISGGLMVAWGMIALAQLAGLDWARIPGWHGIGQRVALRFRALRERPPVVRGFLMGALSALLPCGWLYAFVVTATATADPLRGALVMVAFWMGTVPALVGLGFGVQRLSVASRRLIPWLSAVTVLLVGLFTIWYRVQMPIRFPASRDKAPTSMEQPKTPTAPACH